MQYEPIAKADWPAFVEAFSRLLEGRRVEIEIMGLDLGVQVEAEWLPLRGLRFEQPSETLHLALSDGYEIDHAISGLEQIWAEIVGGELQSLVVIDRDEHKKIIRFHAPLALPATASPRRSSDPAPP